MPHVSPRASPPGFRLDVGVVLDELVVLVGSASRSQRCEVLVVDVDGAVVVVRVVVVLVVVVLPGGDVVVVVDVGELGELVLLPVEVVVVVVVVVDVAVMRVEG